jgi:opacity protein-like surface antigen
MDLSSSEQIPESSEILGWYGSLSTAPGRVSDFSVCFDPSVYGEGDCSRVGTSFDNSFMAGASLGYSFKGGLRLEGEMTQRYYGGLGADGVRDPLGLGQGPASELSLMLNGVYDFDTKSRLTPFIGAGLGGVRIDQQDPGFIGEGFDFQSQDSKWNLGMQGFAGLEYEFSPDLRIGLRFSQKMVKTNKSSFDGGTETGSEGIKNRALMLTLTYEFGP